MANVTFGEPRFVKPELAAEKIEEIEPYKCIHCEEELTSDLLRDTIGLKKFSVTQTSIVNQILPYINKYRKDFGLDTCLRKAHFISQIGVESANFSKLEEGEQYSSSISLGVFSSTKIEINSTIISSLENNLTTIFQILDKDGVEIIKTNSELKTLLLKDKPLVVDGELYAKFAGIKNEKEKGKFKSKLIKEVTNKDNIIDYTINIKPHTYFGIALFSRAYAPYPGDTRGTGNGDELSRDGWKFKGRGLKQLTGRGNYVSFTNYRNKNTFTEDTTGQIDFTQEKNGVQLQGNYLKVSNDAMYATQSALYFWNSGTAKMKKYAKGHADDDNIELVLKCVNEHEKATGKTSKRNNYKRARKEDVFNINRHFELMLENGDESQTKEAKKYLEKQKANSDKQAITILDAYDKKHPVKTILIEKK